MSEKYKNFIAIIIILFLSYWAVKPLFINGYFPMHDDTQILRVYTLAKELKSGIFPVRIVSLLGYGYGYPIFNFYAPLPYYFGAFAYILGFELILATKIMFTVGIIASAFFMFFLAKEMGTITIALAASVFYLYAPYHAVNIYVRGAVGEYFAYAFLPLYVLGMYRLLNGGKNFLIPSVIGLSAIFLSHNILGLIVFYFSILFFCIQLSLKYIYNYSVKKLLRFSFILIISLALSAFFLLPAFFEKKYTKISNLNSGSNNYALHFVAPAQLWDSPWGYGGSAQGTDGMSFKIGKIHLLLGIISLLFSFSHYIKGKLKTNYKYILIAILLILLISITLMLQGSDIIYKSVPLLDFIQYPWRFLNFVVFSLSLSLIFLNLIRNKFLKYTLVIASAVLVIYVNSKYFDVKYIYPLNEKDYLSSEQNLFNVSKISDEYLPPNLAAPLSIKEIKSEHYDINKTVYKTLTLNIERPLVYQSNIAYFPGWEVKDNQQIINFFESNGFIAFNVKQGNHKIEFRFNNTLIRGSANTISFLTFILIIYLKVLDENIWLKKLRLK